MRDLERSVPELEKYRNGIVEHFLKCTQTAFDRIQKTFDLQDKYVYCIKQNLKELEDIKREYVKLHPAFIYLKNQEYSDINSLNNDIEQLKAKQETENKKLTDTERDNQSEYEKLNSIVREYTRLSSSSSSQNTSSDAKDYLQSLGYSGIEFVYETITKLLESHRSKVQRIKDQIAELNLSLNRLESLKNQYELLLPNSHSSSEEINFLRAKRFDNYESFDKTLQEKIKVLNERGKNQQSYHFSDKLDASTANNALIYISECTKVNHDHVRENAIDANENLRRYLCEYGSFIKKEINTEFNYTRTIHDQEDPFLYSQDLEMRLQELLSFRSFVIVSYTNSIPEYPKDCK
ncbi:unnamed protein product [Rotaria sp. Silwood2]|nr:unnamed protein product [Rotaria sp. Silwood2]CAF4720073.1 unnamed protein product [Rotaria sp. Silwood2]